MRGAGVTDMPAQGLALAFAASIYPPAVAAVGRGPRLRSRVFAFVLSAFLTTYVSGAVMLFLFEELGVTSSANRSASAAIYLALGVLLLMLTVRLKRKGPGADNKPEGAIRPSKIDRYLASGRLAFVLGPYAMPFRLRSMSGRSR